MQNFTLEEKRAIMKLLDEIAESDQSLDNSELVFLIQMSKELDYDLADPMSFKNLSHEEAIVILKNMDTNKKIEFREKLLDMAKADHKLPYSETKAIIDILHEGGMDEE